MVISFGSNLVEYDFIASCLSAFGSVFAASFLILFSDLREVLILSNKSFNAGSLNCG